MNLRMEGGRWYHDDAEVDPAVNADLIGTRGDGDEPDAGPVAHEGPHAGTAAEGRGPEWSEPETRYPAGGAPCW